MAEIYITTIFFGPKKFGLRLRPTRVKQDRLGRDFWTKSVFDFGPGLAFRIRPTRPWSTLSISKSFNFVGKLDMRATWLWMD